MKRKEKKKKSKEKAEWWKSKQFLAAVLLAAIFGLSYLSFQKFGGEGAESENVTNRKAIIETSMGTIEVLLYEDKAPITTANFIKLAQGGFYQGLIFHRVIDDFMIQGGGFRPGMVEADRGLSTIRLEIAPGLKHADGAIAMARTSDPNSASSQFYICDGAQPGLDGNYAVFGVVVKGMEVVRAIAVVPTTTKGPFSDVPVRDVVIVSVTIV